MSRRVWGMSHARAEVVRQAAPLLGSLLVLAVEDESYYLAREDDILTVVKAAGIHMLEYIENVSDCDDFNRKLASAMTSAMVAAVLDQAYIDTVEGLVRRPPWLFGIANSVDHAFNFFVPKDRRLRFLEPQTMEVFHPWQLDAYVQELRF